MGKLEFRRSLARHNLTCEKFAELSGVSLSQVYAWGGEYPVPRYVRLIVQLLDDRNGAYGLRRQQDGGNLGKISGIR